MVRIQCAQHRPSFAITRHSANTRVFGVIGKSIYMSLRDDMHMIASSRLRPEVSTPFDRLLVQKNAVVRHGKTPD